MTEPFKICECCGKPFNNRSKASDWPLRKRCSKHCAPQREFWSLVSKTDSCWEWTAGKDTNGYGVFRRVRAHRLSWEMSNGPIPDGYVVCHRCDNPPCVNPAHLFLGTPLENVADCIRKNRRSSKLTLQDVAEARILRADGWKLRDLAARYGASETVICTAVKGRTWAAVSVPPAPDAGWMARRRREALRGRQIANAKLTEDQVRQIRERLLAGERGSVLADEFSVCRQTITNIKQGKIWKHVQ